MLSENPAECEDRSDLASVISNELTDALIVINPDGSIGFWNAGAELMFGHTRQEALGRSFLELVVPADQRDTAIERLSTTLRTGVLHCETERRRKDGRVVQVDSSMQLLHDIRAGHDVVVLSDRAVTRQAVAREAEVLLEAVPDAMVMVNKDGQIMLMNSHAERLFGYPRSELIGKPVELLVPERHRPGQGEQGSGHFTSSVTRAMSASPELAVRRKDGSEFPARIGLSRMETDEGMLVLASVRDVTERKRIEDTHRTELEEHSIQVQEASRIKSEFLANMSHELRTPLNAITGFAQMMYDGKVGPVSSKHREYLGDILTGAHQLLKLISDVVDLAKVESGKMEFHPEIVNIQQLVHEVCKILRTLSASKRIAVDMEIDPNLGPVQLDPGKLKQVLYNYLSNAFKFTPEKGHVVVRALPEGTDLFRLEVEDTGIGIGPEDASRLFVEFQQLDTTVSRKYGGTGLGLALTRRIVEAQGGKVGVRRAAERGSIFFAILPRTSHAAQERHERHQPLGPVLAGEPAVGTPTVLVIEAEPVDRRWLARAILEHGFQAETAGNGADALERCRARRFDAITLGLLLPDSSGWDLLQTIRAGGPNSETPVIVVTVVAKSAAAAGFRIHDYLRKPATLAQLQDSLHRIGLGGKGVRKVLVVDDSPQDLKLAGLLLREAGYHGICALDGAEGLRAAEAERPDAVLLDLLMPGMDGFQFLAAFRRTALGRNTPVVVWTAKDLSTAERAKLQTEVQAVVEKGPRGAAQLLEELLTHLHKAEGTARAR